MSKKRSTSRPKLPRGRPQTHGGHSIFTLKGQLPEHRREIRAYLSASREMFIKNYGPTEEDLSASQLVLINQTVTTMGAVRCMEEWCKENGVMRGNDLAPALRHSYLAYSNTLRLNIMALNTLADGDRAGDPAKRFRIIYDKEFEPRDEAGRQDRLTINVVHTRSESPEEKEIIFNMPRPGQLGEGKSETEARKCLLEAESRQGEADKSSMGNQAGSEIVPLRGCSGQIPEQGQGEGADQVQNRPGIEIQRPPGRRMDELGPGDHVARDDRATRNQVRQLQLEVENLEARKKKLMAARRNIEKHNSEEGQEGRPISVTFPKIRIGEKKR